MMLRALALAAALLGAAAPSMADTEATVSVRGKNQTLHLYGPQAGPPVVVASGDGGWVHLAPDVAAFLAGQGWSVVGVDSKAYLSSFTSGDRTLAPTDVPGDFRTFVDYARQGRPDRVVLVGVSEGAGLSVLAAAEPSLQPLLAGVLGLGLPDVNELGWRWRDSMIYITKKVPNEPTFKAADYLSRLGEVPLAAIHSTHDEFVPLEQVKGLVAIPRGPCRLWVIDAADHRFSDKQPDLQARLGEALAWLAAQPRGSGPSAR